MAETKKSENKRVTIEGVVMAATLSKTKDPSRPTATLQVRQANGKMVIFRLPSMDYPLPGTQVKLTGSQQPSLGAPLMQGMGSYDCVLQSGHQGFVLFTVVREVLDNLKISYNPEQLQSNLMGQNLSGVNADVLQTLLEKSGVANAGVVVDDNDEMLSERLSRAYIETLSKCSVPYKLDKKLEIPFKKYTWPAEIVNGAVQYGANGSMEFYSMMDGRGQHPNVRNGTRVYLHDILSAEGIDNFFASVGHVYAEQHKYVLRNWMEMPRRDSMIAQAYMKDRQKEGIQIFTGEIMRKMETTYGIFNAEKVMSSLNSMYQISGTAIGRSMLSQGTYQSASRIGTLDRFSHHVPLKFGNKAYVPNTQGLDEYQEKTLHALVEGYPVLLISGPPGTGKTTSMSRVIDALEDCGEEYVILTVAGKASSRLNQSMAKAYAGKMRKAPKSRTGHSFFYGAEGRQVSTYRSINTSSISKALDSAAFEMFPTNVERGLRYTTQRDFADKNKRIPKPVDLIYLEQMPAPALTGKTVILDEGSQFTNDMLALIMEMRPKRLIIAGDPWQLPPVGSGKPFQDLIDLVRAGYLKDKACLINLEKDHRATRELADFTKKIRGGKIPSSHTFKYEEGHSMKEFAKEMYSLEGGAIELGTASNVVKFMSELYRLEIENKKKLLHFSNTEDYRGNSDPKAITILSPYKMADGLSAKQAVLPDIMTMAYTNEEVLAMAESAKNILRHYVKSGDDIEHFHFFASLVTNNLRPGDIIMQTKNNKQAFAYKTPAGSHQSNSSANGESFMFMGANIWLPFPEENLSSDIDAQLYNMYERLGLAKKIRDDIRKDPYLESDPNYHLAIAKKLLTYTSESDQMLAHRILRMSLGEMFLLDTSLLQDMNLKEGTVLDLSEKNIPEGLMRIQTVLPRVDRKSKNSVDNDDGMMGLISSKFKIQQMAGDVKVSILDKKEYATLASDSLSALEHYSVGEAYTVHKAQGSQGRVALSVVAEPIRQDNAFQHEQGAYTGLTRAKEQGFMLLHGMTVEQTNTLWDNMRRRSAEIPSANKLIARGEIPPLAETMKMVTTVLPNRNIRNTPLVLNGENVKESYEEALLRRISMSSMGLPSDEDWNNIPAPHCLLAENSSPIFKSGENDNVVAFLDSENIASRYIPKNLGMKKKQMMVWDETFSKKISDNVREESHIDEQDFDNIMNDIANMPFGL